MSKNKKIFAGLALSACMALGAIGLSACNPGADDKTGNANPDIYAIYQLYAESAGDDAMSYDEWLASIKGEKGDKGDKGEKGDKGDKGDEGESGQSGTNGKDGATWIVSDMAPTAEDGKDGDLYLDNFTWNVYHKVDGAWIKIGCLNENTPNVKNFGTLTLAANEEMSLDLADVQQGNYYIIAETEDAATKNTLNILLNKGTASTYVYDMYTPLTHIYRSAVNVNENLTASIKNNSETEMDIKLKLVKFESPVIKLGELIEVPILNSDIGYIPISLDPSITIDTSTQFKVTIKNFTPASSDAGPRIFAENNSTAIFLIAKNCKNTETGDYEYTGTANNAGATGFCFRHTNTSAKICENIVFKIEKA